MAIIPSSKYQNVRRYVDKWHEDYENYNDWDGESFRIYFKDERIPR